MITITNNRVVSLLEQKEASTSFLRVHQEEELKVLESQAVKKRSHTATVGSRRALEEELSKKLSPQNTEANTGELNYLISNLYRD